MTKFSKERNIFLQSLSLFNIVHAPTFLVVEQELRSVYSHMCVELWVDLQLVFSRVKSSGRKNILRFSRVMVIPDSEEQSTVTPSATIDELCAYTKGASVLV